VGHYQYYTIRLGSVPTNLAIRVTSLDGGDPDIYVLNVPNQLPTKENSLWNSTQSQALEFITIPPPHDVNKPYIIGVYGVKTTQFSIVALTDNVVQTVQQGIPIRATVAAGRAVQFVFQLEDSMKDLDIALTTLNGDPDLFVDTKHHPVCDLGGYSPCRNFTWGSTGSGDSVLNISHVAPCANARWNSNCDGATSYGIGPVYIAVYGFTNANFSLIVNMNGDHMSLISGKCGLTTTSICFH
jgi:hypothetical protein